MPTDFTSSDSDPISTESESPMFAPTPSWERGKKRRGFGRGSVSRVAPEPRSFAAELSAEPDPMIAATPTRPVYVRTEEVVDRPDAAFAATPVFASSTAARRGNGAAPIAIAAGIIMIGGLAAAGWYATQPHDSGVAQLTPGEVTTTTVATTAGDTTTAQAAAPTQVAQTITPPAVAKSSSVTTTTRSSALAGPRATVTRTRVAPSAGDVGSNASVRAPAQAAPAPTPAPAAAAAPAPLVLNIPATTAPAEVPMPTQTAPTPPTQTPPN